MGYWFPTYEISGGLYGGKATPSGDLSSFVNMANPRVVNQTLALFASYTDKPSDPQGDKAWQGGYGSSSDIYKTYARANPGPNVDFPFMIFTIKNPEGAQYYKQELVVEMRTSYITRSGGSMVVVPPTYYYVGEYAPYFHRIYRRVYDTPYSTPYVTHEWGVSSGATHSDLIEGVDTLAGWLDEKFYFPISYAEYDGKKYLCFCQYSEQYNVHGEWNQQATPPQWELAQRYNYAGCGISVDALAAAFGGEFALDENDDPNIDPDPGDDPGDNPKPEPGPKEKEYDPIPIPPKPSVTALGAGFLSLYSPSSTLLNLFASEMYSDSILDIIHNYFSSVADMIAGLAIVPFFVPITGFSKHRVGLFRTSMAFPIVSDQFIDVDCGSVSVDHYYNSFLDYAPNTKIMVWLPYIGYQEINADEVMGQTLSIKYRCDILSGACVAFLMIGSGSDPSYNVGRVIAQFTGNVITQVPAAAASYDSMVSSAINILTGAVGIAAGGAIGAAGAGAATGAAAAPSATAGAIGAQVGLGVAGTASNIIMGMKPTVARNGTPGSTAGYMGVQKPYLIKIVPRSAIAPNHIQLQGYPSNYGGTLASLSGYCEVNEIQLNIDPNGTAPEVDEKTEIYRLLKGGVVI